MVGPSWEKLCALIVSILILALPLACDFYAKLLGRENKSKSFTSLPSANDPLGTVDLIL